MSHSRLRLTLCAAALTVLSGEALFAQTAPNDACPNGTVIPASIPATGFSTTVVTTGANDSAGDPVPACLTKFTDPIPTNALAKSVWFTFTPSTTDNYQIDTLGSTPASDYDTIVAIYQGLCAGLVPLANGCSDDTVGSLQSSVSLALNAGTTYTIMVAGIGSRDSFNPTQIEASRGGTLRLNVKRISINYPYKYVVPSVALAQGATLFVSDLNVTNAEAVDGSFTIKFLGHGNFSEQNPPPNQPVIGPTSIAPLGSREYINILGTSFNLSNDYGALLVESTRRLVIGARTYTTGAEGGTYGQFAPAYDTSTELLATGETGRLIGVREDAAFRTNIALFNLSNTTCGVQLEVRDNFGQVYPAGARLPVLPPNTMVQISGIKNYFGFDADVRNSSISVRNVAQGCTVGGIGYVIDRATNDPFAVPLKK